MTPSSPVSTRIRTHVSFVEAHWYPYGFYGPVGSKGNPSAQAVIQSVEQIPGEYAKMQTILAANDSDATVTIGETGVSYQATSVPCIPAGTLFSAGDALEWLASGAQTVDWWPMETGSNIGSACNIPDEAMFTGNGTPDTMYTGYLLASQLARPNAQLSSLAVNNLSDPGNTVNAIGFQSVLPDGQVVVALINTNTSFAQKVAVSTALTGNLTDRVLHCGRPAQADRHLAGPHEDRERDHHRRRDRQQHHDPGSVDGGTQELPAEQGHPERGRQRQGRDQDDRQRHAHPERRRPGDGNHGEGLPPGRRQQRQPGHADRHDQGRWCLHGHRHPARPRGTIPTSPITRATGLYAWSTASHAVQVTALKPALKLAASARSVKPGRSVTVTATLGATHGNRTVLIYAQPKGGAKKLIKRATVNSKGQLSIGYVMRVNTTFSVAFLGDTWYGPATVTAVVKA